MKTNIFKYTIPLGFLCFVVACSTRNNSFLSRNSHALSTKYNILYNGGIGLDKGIQGIEGNNKDNFWKRLPIERMQINDDFTSAEKTKNSDFELAETKATKAIQKHSMNIDGKERNYQIDEAYLLLGKARYYDQRFIPALDAFNYILYKYPNSSRIYEAKIWSGKTNMRLGNDALVVNNMTTLLKEQKLKSQVVADVNALLSEAYLNLEEKDSALYNLKLAEKFSKKNKEKARYRFILGQLYEELGKKDSAIYSYESVIKMNRKSERKYVIQAQARKAQLFDYQNGDTTAFVKTYKKLIADRENRPFLDVLNYEMGVFYDKQDNQKKALNFYNFSLDKAGDDKYLVASNYRNIANMYFRKAEYPVAAKYYDSTLTNLNLKTREFVQIQKVRKDLDEVILYEDIASRNDSILRIVSMSEAGRISYFENYIDTLKKKDEAKRILEEKLKEKQDNRERNNKTVSNEPAVSAQNSEPRSPFAPPAISASNAPASVFYFYNPTTVSYGKLEFKKIWGNRSSEGNWRLSSTAKSTEVSKDDLNTNPEIQEEQLIEEEVLIVEEYTSGFYLKQLPSKQTSIDSIAKERNTAYYQLGVIYKEKFKEYELASNRLEQLLQNSPEEKLILPTMYNLYKIYQITNSSKAAAMKDRINSQYPNSRYAQIINKTNLEGPALSDSPEEAYDKLYKRYENEEFLVVLEQSDEMINQFSGDEIVSKFEFLKANTLGKLKGLKAYKNALQFVVDNYPNSEEGKKAQEILKDQIPFLEKLELTTAESKNWKILYRVPASDVNSTKLVEEKIKKLTSIASYKDLSYSVDEYSGTENLIVIHGINSEEYARNISTTLREKNDFKVVVPAIILSNENYKIIQIKKNLDVYSGLKKE
ncbi:type IX secretion system periplasmic lipoprotein PorW/SprE [Flavobacterium hiemivividum]|uniref:Gliding motility protein n=1 Tax=Flavobacterium hiemivividum TaxID=2541734 RepID=A0A4R5D0N8_9FLAO|nr:tetratricopeptide repeat protein [Flavobacterium hiemivividum]TDE06772.1 gliding motility protein [Flavobacterium hiemivividum]